MSGAVYLDYNATAPLKPDVIRAITESLGQVGNASSVHRFGRAARGLVEAARRRVAGLVGATPDQVVFTGGGTEANNLALAGSGLVVLGAAGEHESVARRVAAENEIPIGRDGLVDLGALERMLATRPGPVLVAVMLANNETGAIQPVAEVAALARAHGARVHCDAVQAAGKIPVDIGELGVDTLALSAHKLGGPQGVGALIMTEGRRVEPQLLGGGQESGRRAGTENVAGLHGFGVAAELAAAGLDAFGRLAEMRDRLEGRLRQAVPDLRVVAEAAPRLPNTSCLAMPGVESATQVMALDLAGFAVSAGSACTSGRVRASRVLSAMGLPDSEAGSAIRVSLGWGTTPAEVERFAEAWLRLWGRVGPGDGNLCIASSAAIPA